MLGFICTGCNFSEAYSFKCFLYFLESAHSSRPAIHGIQNHPQVSTAARYETNANFYKSHICFRRNNPMGGRLNNFNTAAQR